MKDLMYNILQIALLSQIGKKLENLQLTVSNDEAYEDEPLIEITPLRLIMKHTLYSALILQRLEQL